MHPRKFIRDSVGYALTQYVVRAGLMLRGIVAAKLLGPQQYGAWNALQLIMDYGLFAPLGTQQGLDQQVPARIVAGDEGRLDQLKRAGLFNILVFTLVFSAVCLAWVKYGSSSRVLDAWGFVGIAGALATILLTNVAYYHLTVLRSHGNIQAVSGWYFWQGLVGAVIGLALIPWLGMWSLLWGWLLGTASAAVYTRWHARAIAPLAARPSEDSLALLRAGFPMFVFTGSALVMRTLDRLIVLRYLGTEELGYYSLSVMALTFLLYLPDSIAYVVYPRLLHDFSASGRDPAAIQPMLRRVFRASSLLVPLLCGLAYLLSNEVAMAVLPRFLPGVPALRVLSFGAVGLALANLGSITLMTLGRQTALVPVALFVTALGAALDVAAVKAGYGITGVAWATLATYTLNGILLLLLACSGLAMRARETFLAVARLIAPFLFAMLAAWALDRLLPWRTEHALGLRALRSALECVLFLGAYALFAVPFVRGLGVMQLASEFQLPIVSPLLRRLRRPGGAA